MKKFFNKLFNPLLFYVTEDGCSVFKNYCLFKFDGCMYNEKFEIKKAGEVLEYRIELDKYLKLYVLFITIFSYFVLIHGILSFSRLLFVEIIWVLLVYFGRYICADLYNKRLLKHFGVYEVCDFSPKLLPEKRKEYMNSFFAKVQCFLLILVILFAPAFCMYYFLKTNLNSSNPNYKLDKFIAKTYLHIYPKIPKIYDMSAYSKYMMRDFEGAVKDYKSLFLLTGKKFSEQDLTRFANLLFLEKRLHGSTPAIDLFNEYATRKKMSVLKQSQMLWIKSIFSIENDLSDTVIQDYQDMLMSLAEKDYKNKFYIMADEAYMLYLMHNYEDAIKIYDVLIPYAQSNKKDFGNYIQNLYVERGYAKLRMGDNLGADSDFLASGMSKNKINMAEPRFPQSGFAINKF